MPGWCHALISAIERLCLKMALQNGWGERAALASNNPAPIPHKMCVQLPGWGLLGGRTAEVTVCPTDTNPKSSPCSLQNSGFPKQNPGFAFRVHEFHPSCSRLGETAAAILVSPINGTAEARRGQFQC